MNTRPLCEPKLHIGVDDFIWLLPVLSSWYPYFKWLYQLIFLGFYPGLVWKGICGGIRALGHPALYSSILPDIWVCKQ